MIFGHDYIAPPGLVAAGPPVHPIADLTPPKMDEWIAAQIKGGQGRPLAERIAAERRARAYGHGSQRWDPLKTKSMPPGWIYNKDQRYKTRGELLQDINDLVSVFLGALSLEVLRFCQVVVYSNLTGSASLFITTHPKRDPKIPDDQLPESLFLMNTLFIPSDNLSDQKDVVSEIARSFTEQIGVNWCTDWERRAIYSKYLQGTYVPLCNICDLIIQQLLSLT